MLLDELVRTYRRQCIEAEFLHHAPRHGANVHAGDQRLPHMLGMAHRREHNFGLVIVFVDNIDALLKQRVGVMPLVLQAARQAGIRKRRRQPSPCTPWLSVYIKVYVGPCDPLWSACCTPLRRNRKWATLKTGSFGHRQIEQAMRLADDFVVGIAERLDLKLGHHLRQLDDRTIDIGYAVPVHEGRRRGQPGQKTEIKSFFNFLKID